MKGLTKKALLSLGIPAVFVPGLILAAVLGWNWQRDLAKLSVSGGFRKSSLLFPKYAVVESVVDGDTFKLKDGQAVRMVGINAPDRGEKGWEEASHYLKNLIEGEEVRLEYDVYQDDKFGRILAYVWEQCQTQIGCNNGERMVNWLMVKKGLAKVVVYRGRKKLKYQDLLFKAEQ